MESISKHMPEYAAEALGLAAFMLSACFFAVHLEHPASPLRARLPKAAARRALMGLAMGLTALAIIYSPLGVRSGAHLNPAVTLTFWSLERIRTPDALAYVCAQFVGGLLGVLCARNLLRGALAHSQVNYVVTQPGRYGRGAALLAETAISFIMMTVVLKTASVPRLAPWTGCFAATLVALFIWLEAPLSGMSMNPARSLASALPARDARALWLYFVGPLCGMLLAAALQARPAQTLGGCAKLYHSNQTPCIFCGDHREVQP